MPNSVKNNFVSHKEFLNENLRNFDYFFSLFSTLEWLQQMLIKICDFCVDYTSIYNLSTLTTCTCCIWSVHLAVRIKINFGWLDICKFWQKYKKKTKRRSSRRQWSHQKTSRGRAKMAKAAQGETIRGDFSVVFLFSAVFFFIKLYWCFMSICQVRKAKT